MNIRKLLKDHLTESITAVIFLILLLFPVFTQKTYIITILVMTVYTASCSLAWSILGGQLGKVSLGHAAFGAVGAYIGMFMVDKLGISPWIAMIVAFLAVGSIMAMLMYPCFNLKGAYFSLSTIAFGEAFRNLFTNWNAVGGAQGVKLPMVKKSGESLWMLAFHMSNKTAYFYVGLFLLIVFYLILKWLDGSRLGYAFKTIREDEGTAQAIGIRPVRYQVIATFISTGMVAMMGVFYACYIRYINPDLMMQSKSLEFVLPTVIGGISTVEGPVIGAMIIVPLSEWLNGWLGSMFPGLNLLIYSLILIIVVLFRPSGILGWFKERQQKRLIETEKKAMNLNEMEV